MCLQLQFQNRNFCDLFSHSSQKKVLKTKIISVLHLFRFLHFLELHPKHVVHLLKCV